MAASMMFLGSERVKSRLFPRSKLLLRAIATPVPASRWRTGPPEIAPEIAISEIAIPEIAPEIAIPEIAIPEIAPEIAIPEIAPEIAPEMRRTDAPS
ncbi:hypothetical protein Ctob_008266 [Chrysochromulina tobinii]|uniref:Uncharacterized protein n=1 Tax=Chrysochromulina tobinii TaxID=1460289 RepID=A0A0M0JWU3_9EUKA|nr:hypothetical protein Ctob_008266 [Chrysochromulina tobinii]|eukprot:KOO30608.1 hypothetical protein Ctob_008266 [Chrysochromulina sp. CCMP291]